MKTLVYLSFLLFCFASLSITAQVCYSPTLKKIFVGPENVTNQNDSLISKQLYLIQSGISKLERVLKKEILNQSGDAVKGDLLVVERDNLNLLLIDWQRLQKDENNNPTLNLSKDIKVESVETLPLIRKREYRTTVVNGEAVTIEVDPNTIKRTTCGNYNCLSADPKDCIQWNLARKHYSDIKDSYGIVIPFMTILKTYNGIQILDNLSVLGCKRML